MPPPSLTITPTPDGLSIALPAPGLRGAKSELVFACGFGGVLLFITAIFGVIAYAKPAGLPFVFPVVLGLFWLVTIGLFVSLFQNAARTAIIDVVGDAVLITTRAPLSRTSIEFTAGNVKALGVGPSGVVVDDMPVLALRIDLKKPVPVGKKNKRVLKLFSERDDADLVVIAERLRAKLGIEADTDPSWAADGAASSVPGRRR